MPIVLPVYGSRDSEIRMRPIARALEAAGYRVPAADRARARADPAPLIEQHRPDAVLVHGGSATALAGAMAASERGIPIAHVDAGRCDGDVTDVLPHEPVRRMLGRMAALHLAPTEHARRVLLASAVPEGRIVVTGDPIVDAVLSAAHPAEAGVVTDEHGRAVLVAAHTTGNRGVPMQRIGSAVRVLAARFPGHAFVLCSGPELAVHARLTTAMGRAPNIISTPLPPFERLVGLLRGAALALTDCGELEEIAPTLDVPVLVLAATTDRPEGVLAGTSRMVGTHVETIVEEASAILADPGRHAAAAGRRTSPFGDGRAAQRVVAALDALLGRGERMPDFVFRAAADIAAR